MKKKRNSSIELLRILMMFQIIFLHISDYGGYTDTALAAGGKIEFTYWVIWLMSRCPVYMFIVIMGYFMCEAGTEPNWKRVLRAYIPMPVYSVIITVVAGILRPEKVDMVHYVKAFVPFLSRTWYFMTLYLLVLILSPYINRAINGLSRRDFLVLLGITFFIFSIWQPLSMLSPFSSLVGIKKIISTDGGKSLYDFIFMYLLGAFMRRYSFVGKEKKQSGNPLLYLGIFVLLGLVNLLLVYAYPDANIKRIIGYNDEAFSVLQCIFLFRFFEGIDLSRYDKLGNVINFISAGNLGVYMIHEHPYVRSLIWNEVFNLNSVSFYKRPDFLLCIIGIILAVYFVCWTIDLARRMVYFAVAKTHKKE